MKAWELLEVVERTCDPDDEVVVRVRDDEGRMGDARVVKVSRTAMVDVGTRHLRAVVVEIPDGYEMGHAPRHRERQR